ncbi:MAG: hypothetical protein AAGF94_03145 [Pseudomonadota bacterium]
MTRLSHNKDYESHIGAVTPRPVTSTLWPEGKPANFAGPKPMGTPRIIVHLGGDFSASTIDGTPLRLSQKKGRLMLAMLACSPGMRRSRDWLRRHLWHRAFTAHGFSSLRQCLHNVRKSLEPEGECLCADRDYIWLEGSAVDVSECQAIPTRFLEDLPRIDGPVQEWLEVERLRLARGETASTRW